MAIYRYIVTVETSPDSPVTSRTIAAELDSNLESTINDLCLEHFTVEAIELLDQKAFHQCS